jgi:hypothetical protein
MKRALWQNPGLRGRERLRKGKDRRTDRRTEQDRQEDR